MIGSLVLCLPVSLIPSIFCAKPIADMQEMIVEECYSTAAEGQNFRGTSTGGTTFVHLSRIALRYL